MALAADAILPILEGEYADLPVLNATKIYQGAVVSITAAGYAKGYAGSDSIFAGIADRQADNSAGAVGAINVRVRRDVHWRQVTLASVALANVGDAVYASADDTFTLTRGSNLRVGTVAAYVTTNTCIVRFEPTVPRNNPRGKTLAFVGAAAAGACTCTGAVVGELVGRIVGTLTAGGPPLATAVADFESVITVADQIQQVVAADLHLNTYQVELFPAGT